jgi:putative ABC transport system permease protein
MLRQYEAPVEVLPGSTTSVIEGLDPRPAVRALSLVVNLLAVLILVTGGVGLLSLMMVEVLSRSRQIALSRAFGATKGAIVREYLARSLILVGAASVLGIGLSLFLSGPLTALVMPIFQDAAEIDLTGPVITPAAVAAGVAAALGVGGLLGPLPVFSALAAPIAEGIRD